jgi:integrase
MSGHGVRVAPVRSAPVDQGRACQADPAAGLPWLHLHDLRHAFATFLLDQGEELRTVMELLGHSTIRLTADTYGHVLPARARQAASVIDRILGEEPA